MVRLIQTQGLKEGEFFCKWLKTRLLVNNKNVLGAELGPTGSGKSYRDLRKMEIYYRDYLKKDFPVENICFGVGEIMKRLTSGELSKGDILMFEEAGANLGSLDFQNKVSKMFTYVLQSFRSMNIAIFFNLPYLSMLNKTARLLLHYSSTSVGINFQKKRNVCKFFFHQVNQTTGKIYTKSPIVFNGKRKRTIRMVGYSMPSPWLVEQYERKKAKYLSETTTDYTEEIRRIEYEKMAKMERDSLTEKQRKIKDLIESGLSYLEVAEITETSHSNISHTLKAIKKKGYEVNIPKKPKKIENNDFKPDIPSILT